MFDKYTGSFYYINMYRILIISVAVSLLSGCSAKKDVPAPAPPISKEATVISGPLPDKALPRAVLYKTNGDYSDHVFVNVGPDSRLVSYPAPTDVSAASSALPVGSGWLLDRRGGIGEDSRFLKWTYAEYAALPSAPSPSEIIASIIPDARVTDIRVLPISASEAISDPALVSKALE